MRSWVYIPLVMVLVASLGILSTAGGVYGWSDDEDDTAEEFWDTIVGFIEKIANGIIDFILAPFEAIGEIFDNWADTLSSWYSPILMGLVIIIIMVMYRLYAYLDDFLDGWT